MIRRPDPSLLDLYDTLLLDLDGTLMHGGNPIPHAAEAVQRAREADRTIVFATNNASRTPQQAAEHLAHVGVTAHPAEFATSPQIAARLLAEQLEQGQHVLVVGGSALASEVRAAGLTPVERDDDDVAAVIQGWSPELGWSHLAEGAYAIARGALWMATNTDATLPTERGMAPGNGSLVAALRHATGQEPMVAGKPEPGMFRLAAESHGARRPLVIGDRLDTDIEGAVRAEMDSLLVLTGVDTIETALRADAIRRPTYVLPDLSGLHAPFALPVVDGTAARCGATGADLAGDDLHLRGELSDARVVTAALALLRRHYPDTAFTGRILGPDGTETVPLPR